MFTGIISDTPKILNANTSSDGLELTVERPASWTEMELGESISHNGVCLTVTEINPGDYKVFLMPETLNLTSYGNGAPSIVNVERSMRAGDRFGGHFVQGHADGTGKVTAINSSADYRIEIEYPAEHMALVAHKGSITIDGVSLTVAECKDNRLTVALIPHTLGHTTLSDLKVGDSVNLEFDMIAKHVATMLALQKS